MHPLFHLIASRPQLLADHAQAYAELVAEEIPRVSAAWKRSALLTVAATFGMTLALGLVGVALMLWAVLPEASMRAPWALLVVPLVPLAAALACALAARRGSELAAFEELRLQVRADIGMLREVAA